MKIGLLTMKSSIVILLVHLVICHAQILPLGTYNIDTTKVSCSGPSSGAMMATQFHVAFSASIMGAALFAGGPYWCARGDLVHASVCMLTPSLVDVPELVAKTNDYASRGLIDQTIHMYESRVFLWAGTEDIVVDPVASEKAQEYYQSLVDNVNIKTELGIVAAHTQPTLEYGNECTQLGSPFMGRCNYDGAFESLDHIYGPGLVRPAADTPTPGEFYTFDQKEFFVLPPATASMDDVGFVYVPTACVSGDVVCKLHVVFHGCLQGQSKIGDDFAKNAGYNAVGELNNIIMLYPQVIALLDNPQGCWDWWGYTAALDDYATQVADQMRASHDMVLKMTGQ